MTEPLPQRPFTALPPPPDGVAQALRDGRRMRLRRRLAGAGAAALSVAVAVGAAAVLGPGATGASDTLVPAAPPSPSATPSPGAPGPAAGDRSSPAAAPSRSPDAAGGSSPAPARVAASPAAGQQPAPEPVAGPAGPSYRPPDLIRAYHPPAPPPPGQGPSARVCGGTLSNGEGTVDAGAGWCVSALAVRTGRGHDLTVEVCRDRTGPGTLRFPRELEAELTVLEGDRKLWVWSAGRSDERAPHSLDVQTDGCWTWTAPWTDVDAQGRPLEIGDYTLAVTSRAQEADARPAQATIQIR